MFVFNENEQIVRQLKKLYIDENIMGLEIAEKLGMSQQNFSKTMYKKNLSFNDVKRILDVLGYDLEINFKKR